MGGYIKIKTGFSPYDENIRKKIKYPETWRKNISRTGNRKTTKSVIDRT